MDDIYKLYQTYEQEIRGENKPIEDVDHRPNYIGMCINMMETPQMKIKCLRKVKEMTAMNPFYQYRIDRFVDAITDTYEPTTKPGFVEYIKEEVDGYLDYLNDQGAPGSGPPGSGPPGKEIKLKSSGAEQDDEEPPTDERTKKFEKEEAKVGVEEISGAIAQGVSAVGNLAMAHPGIAAGTVAGMAGLAAARKIHKNLKQDKVKACYDRHEGYPERLKACLRSLR